ncbi:MAG: PAS domain S-box protein [Actinobacteria bacterium]|nr:MAG: PAS domain S-box protein [Actinomycetota bacterium]
MFYDVTARRTAERALTQAEDRFRSLVERLPQIVYVEDALTGEDIYVSPQIEAVYGYTSEEWMRDPGMWEQSIHPDDRAWVMAADQEDTGDRWSIDHRSITRDGRVIWIHNDAELLRDGEGNPLYWQGVIYDITERKQAEERLREAEERYRTLVEQLPVAIYTDATDDLSTALYISPQYERLTGYTPEQRLMDPGLWVRMLHPEDRERVLVESKRTNETGDPFDVEYRVVRADGTITWLHDRSCARRRSGTDNWSRRSPPSRISTSSTRTIPISGPPSTSARRSRRSSATRPTSGKRTRGSGTR